MSDNMSNNHMMSDGSMLGGNSSTHMMPDGTMMDSKGNIVDSEQAGIEWNDNDMNASSSATWQITDLDTKKN